LQVRLWIALSKADGHRRSPKDAKLIKKMAYRLPTVNRTVATARLAMTELAAVWQNRLVDVRRFGRQNNHRVAQEYLWRMLAD
jgi:hypothetical protein